MLPSMFADGYAQPAAFTPSHDVEADVRRVLHDALQLGDEAWALRADSPLLGSLPQLDSMGVLAVLTALEQQLGVPIHDDEIDASLFATLGTLTAFVRERLKSA
ncbi:MAG: acyl carrier protein [Pseudomonadota bacterium]